MTTTKVGDRLSPENAEVGMVVRHFDSGCEWVLVEHQSRGWAVTDRETFHIVALPEEPAGAKAEAEAAQAVVAGRFAPGDKVRVLRDMYHAIVKPVAPRQTHCEHGLPRVADCTRCDYDRRFYARAENTAALTEADTRMLLRSPDGSGWVLKVTLTAPQTREDRLRAAGWRVEDGR